MDEEKKIGRPAEYEDEEHRKRAEYMREYSRRARSLEAMRQYRQTPEYKERRKKYRKRPHIHAQEMASQMRRYHELGRANSRQRRCEVKRKYGITVAEYDRRKAEQEGRCAICQESKPLNLDHDHATGELRYFLCSSCNNGLGRFKDRADVLRRAADYLEGKISWQSPTALRRNKSASA